MFRLVRRSNPGAGVCAHHRATEPRWARRSSGCETEGVDAICYKPFDIPELLKTLGRLAEARGNVDVVRVVRGSAKMQSDVASSYLDH